MLTAPMPLDEPERLLALERLDVLDSAPEREFDALVATAALVCGVPRHGPVDGLEEPHGQRGGL